MKRIIALVLTLMLILPLFAMNFAVADSEKTMIYATDKSWNRLMPYDLNGLNMIMVNDKIFDKLTYLSGEGLGLRAAESIEVEDGGKTFVIKIRENSFWHDGTPVTINDWIWTLNTMSDPVLSELTARVYLNVFDGTDNSGARIEGETFGVEKVDEYTMKWHLKTATSPEAFFFSYNNRFSVLPEHLLKDIPLDKLNSDSFWASPIGSGPYCYVSEVSGQEITLRAFDQFELGRPQIDNLVYKVMDNSSFSNALLSGEADMCYSNLTAEEALSLDGINGLHTEEVTGNTIAVFFTINNEKFNPNVRRAFSLLLNKEFILQAVFGGNGMVAESWVLPTSPYYNTNLKFERNVEEAVRILQAENFDFSQTLTIGASNTERQNIALIAKNNFAEAGLNLEVIQGENLFARASSGELDMTVISWTSSASPTYWLSYQYGSYSRIQDAKYSDLMKAVNVEGDIAKKTEMMYDLQELYAEECPYIPICHQYLYVVLSEKLHNVSIPNVDQCWNWEMDD